MNTFHTIGTCFIFISMIIAIFLFFYRESKRIDDQNLKDRIKDHENMLKERFEALKYSNDYSRSVDWFIWEILYTYLTASEANRKLNNNDLYNVVSTYVRKLSEITQLRPETEPIKTKPMRDVIFLDEGIKISDLMRLMRLAKDSIENIENSFGYGYTDEHYPLTKYPVVGFDKAIDKSDKSGIISSGGATLLYKPMSIEKYDKNLNIILDSMEKNKNRVIKQKKRAGKKKRKRYR